MELEYSFELLCAGIELKQPQALIKNGQISMSTRLRKDPVNIDMYCDNKHQQLIDLHPKLIDQQVEKLSEQLEKAKADDEYFWGAKFLGFEEWWPGRHMNLQLVSPYLHHLSSHYPYEDWCTTNHPTLDKFKCAMVYSYFKKHDDYDRIMDFDRSFFGYHDDVEQK